MFGAACGLLSPGSESRKNRLSGKTIAISLRGLKKLQDAVKKYPGKPYFHHNRRFEPSFNPVHEIIRSGIPGEVYEIRNAGL